MKPTEIVNLDFNYMRKAIEEIEKTLNRLKYRFIDLSEAFMQCDDAIADAWILMLINKGGNNDGQRKETNGNRD
jgi:hypothetical protein